MIEDLKTQAGVEVAGEASIEERVACRGIAVGVEVDAAGGGEGELAPNAKTAVKAARAAKVDGANWAWQPC